MNGNGRKKTAENEAPFAIDRCMMYVNRPRNVRDRLYEGEHDPGSVFKPEHSQMQNAKPE